MTANIK